jgi:hypothetical protein
MNTIPPLPVTNTKPRRRLTWGRLFAWCGLAMLTSLLFLALAAWSLLTPSRELASLRDSLSTSGGRSVRVQFDLGYVSTLLIRTGLGFAPRIPAEGRVAISALRGASVGVYHVGTDKSAAAAGWSGADVAMADRGYQRIVSVREPGTLVGVWVLGSAGAGERLKVCVAVRDHEELVLVSAEADADSLSKLVGTLPKDWLKERRS